MKQYELTGKARVNTKKDSHIFSPDEEYMVIEVEAHYPEGEDDWRGMPTYPSYKKWKLATPLDIIKLNAMGIGELVWR